MLVQFPKRKKHTHLAFSSAHNTQSTKTYLNQKPRSQPLELLLYADVDADLYSVDDSRLESRHLLRVESFPVRYKFPRAHSPLSIMNQFSHVLTDEGVDVAAAYQSWVQYQMHMPDCNPLWSSHRLAASRPRKKSLLGPRFCQCTEPISSHFWRNIL